MFGLSSHRPADDVVGIVQDRPEGCLTTSIPEFGSVQRPPQCSPHDPRGHHPSRQVEKDQKIGTLGQQRAGDGVLLLRDPLILSSQSDDVVAKRRSRLPLRTVAKGVNLHIGQRQVGPYLPCKRRLADACRTRHQDSLRLPRQRIGPLQDRHSSKGRFEARRHSCVGWFCRADSVEQVPSQRFEDSLRGTFAFGARSHEDSDVRREPGWVGYQAPP